MILINHDLMLFEMMRPKLLVTMKFPACALDFSALTKTFLPPPQCLRDHQEGRCGKSVRSRRWREGMWCVICWAWCVAIAIMISIGVVVCTGMRKTGPVDSQSWKGSYPSLLNHQLLVDSGVGAVTVFQCLPTVDPTRLHWTVPHP